MKYAINYYQEQYISYTSSPWSIYIQYKFNSIYPNTISILYHLTIKFLNFMETQFLQMNPVEIILKMASNL